MKVLLYLSYVKYKVNKLALLKKEYTFVAFLSGMVLVMFCNFVLIIMK